MLHVVTAVCGDRPTDFAAVASPYHIVKFVKDIWKTIASMKYSVTSARYIYKIVLFLQVTITCILHIGTNRIIISHIAIVTRSLVCVSQNCQKRRTKRRTALNNVVSETSLPVTRYDTSFETLVNTRQHTIQDIVRDALQQHGY